MVAFGAATFGTSGKFDMGSLVSLTTLNDYSSCVNSSASLLFIYYCFFEFSLFFLVLFFGKCILLLMLFLFMSETRLLLFMYDVEFSLLFVVAASFLVKTLRALAG